FTLPRGATALDYAYEIHSEIGLYAKEAYINRVRMPLLTELKNGDIVRIVTGEEAKFRCSWINSVRTGKAKATIRSFCKQKIKDINYKMAIDILKSVFNVSKDRILEWIECENLGKKVFRAATDSEYLQEVANMLKKYIRKERPFMISLGDKYQIKKQKFENIVIYSNHKISNVEFDYCCNPKRGDDIVGFRNYHHVTVHHKLCERFMKLAEEKNEMIFVKWTRVAPHRFKIILSLENRRGSLAEFLTYMAKMQVDLVTISLTETREATADFFELTIELGENLNVNEIKERLRDRYKIIDFVSLDDAYGH
ncbi:TGS domain-containing protein, partial [uncultured Campylobacter sp.]|uniref:TGS domain-containing protein n=1 Tax=uncultured Campylobacter sp. TaxID=218934 RepID=UPI0026395309